MRQVPEIPAHHTMDRRDQPALDEPCQRFAWIVIELGQLARRLSVDQSLRTIPIDAQHPVPDHLKPDIADPRRI